MHHSGKPCRYRFAQRPPHGQLAPVFAVLAGSDFDVSVRFAGRLGGNDVHHAAGGIAPEQGALRASQYLDALDIVHGERHAAEIAVVGTVGVHRHRLLLVVAEIELPDSAHGIHRAPAT